MSEVRRYEIVTRPLKDNTKYFRDSRHVVSAYSADDAIAQAKATAGRTRICDMDAPGQPLVEEGVWIVSVSPYKAAVQPGEE